jgi:hypothetical protein
MPSAAPPANTVKCVISGTLPSGEIFAFGFQMDGSGISGQLALTQLLGVVSGSLTGNFLTTAVKALFGTGVVFTTVSLYYYNGGSTAALQAQNSGINTPGTSAAAQLPDQCALVVSLLTGIPGRTKRGRLYLPPMSAGLMNGNGQLSSATCTTVAAAMAAFFNGIRTSANGAQPVVASATAGTKTPLTSVRVDSIVDTQRRRRNKIIPAASIVNNGV